MAHWLTPAGPSIWVEPFMKRPWKCRLVLWFPSWLSALTTTRSPTVAVMGGKGHWPLMPMVGRSNAPSGFAVTQVMLKSYVTVAACTRDTEPYNRHDATNDGDKRITKDEGARSDTPGSKKDPGVSGLRIRSSFSANSCNDENVNNHLGQAQHSLGSPGY